MLESYKLGNILTLYPLMKLNKIDKHFNIIDDTLLDVRVMEYTRIPNET